MDEQQPSPQSDSTPVASALRMPEVSRKIMIRLLDQRDSVHDLTEMLHRAYKRHADRGMRDDDDWE